MYSPRLKYCKYLLIGAVYGKRGKGRPQAMMHNDNIREVGANQSFVDVYRLAQIDWHRIDKHR